MRIESIVQIVDTLNVFYIYVLYCMYIYVTYIACVEVQIAGFTTDTAVVEKTAPPIANKM